MNYISVKFYSFELTYTEARHQGSPNQKLENIVLPPESSEFYKFQDTVLNPKSAYFQKMNGECILK